jgi:hypothetical protein
MTSSAKKAVKQALPLDWLPVSTDGLDMLAGARSETINLLQWLVRIAKSYVTAATPEDSIEIGYRPADSAFVTKTFENNISLEMRLPALEMQFIEDGTPVPHILDPEDRSPAQVEAWLLVELLHRGVDRSRFSKKLPYAVSGLVMGDAEKHSPEMYQNGLKQLTAWLRNAAVVLEATARAKGIGDARIVCLPQTLSLTCLQGAESKQVGFGFSPGDAHNHEPFFYTNAHAAAASGNGKKSAILKASQLLADRDPAEAAVTFMKGVAR